MHNNYNQEYLAQSQPTSYSTNYSSLMNMHYQPQLSTNGLSNYSMPLGLSQPTNGYGMGYPVSVNNNNIIQQHGPYQKYLKYQSVPHVSTPTSYLPPVTQVTSSAPIRLTYVYDNQSSNIYSHEHDPSRSKS